ncbi:MAG: hypothetical protein SWH61_09050 [Thermodesulfobacteriota bacterium]|nr:hypothetical protein [Thermodesulfobacteriota bacterium]
MTSHTHTRMLTISAWLLFFCFSRALPVYSASTDVTIKKTFLTKQPKDTLVYFESAAFSPDSTHVAYVAVSKKGMRVVANQSVGNLYDHIAKDYPVFSPKKNRVGYIADKNGNHFVVVDGNEHPGYDGACCLDFSPDGNHFWYIAQKEEKQLVVFDGRALANYDMIDRQHGVIFSPDTKHIAYIIRDKAKNVVQVVLDNKLGPALDRITEIAFSPDSTKLVYFAVKDDAYYILENNEIVTGPIDKVEALTWQPGSATFACMGIKTGNFVVIKGNKEINAGSYNVKTIFDKGKGYTPMLPQTTPPVFSPDGSRFAYTKMVGEQYQPIIDGIANPAFDLVSTVTFSPDSKHYAYIGINQNPYVDKQVVIQDGKKGPTFQKIASPVFSPDSSHLAYPAFSEGSWKMVLDGKYNNSYDAVGEPVFSDNSNQMAYRALSEQRWRIVHKDGASHNLYDAVSPPSFSAGGKHLAYYASIRNRIMMIVDNREQGPYLDVTGPFFSPDGTHVVYLAKYPPGNEREGGAICVVNGKQVGRFTTYMPGLQNQVVFDTPDRFHFIAGFLNQKDQIFEIFLLEMTINNEQ